MLAAGLKPQTELGLVQQHIGDRQQDDRHEHEPVELKAADVHKERLFDIDVADGGRHVGNILRGIDSLDDDRRGCGTQQVHGRTDQRLIRLEVDGRYRKQQGEQNTEEHSHQRGGQHHDHRRRARREVFHHQRTAQRTEHHDALQADIDHTGMLREATAQRHQQQHRGEHQHVLNQQRHFWSASFRRVASAFRVARRVMTCRKNSTKPHM